MTTQLEMALKDLLRRLNDDPNLDGCLDASSFAFDVNRSQLRMAYFDGINKEPTEWDSHGWRKLMQETLVVMLNETPPMQMIDDYLDTDSIELQEFCIDHARLQWWTGISCIDAARLMVTEARWNANIDDYGVIQ